MWLPLFWAAWAGVILPQSGSATPRDSLLLAAYEAGLRDGAAAASIITPPPAPARESQTQSSISVDGTHISFNDPHRRRQGRAARPFAVVTQASVTVAYTVRVGLLTDSAATPSACSTSAQLATCNLRSALALCMALFTSKTCPTAAANALALGCTVVLPANSVSAIKGRAYGTVANIFTALSNWADTCQYTAVSLSLTSGSIGTVIVSDASPASLVVTHDVPLFSFTMTDVTLTNFGNSSSSFGGALSLGSCASITLLRCRFTQNSGLSGGAVVLTDSKDVYLAQSSFTGNTATQAVGSAYGGALAILSCSNVALSLVSFANNAVLGKAASGAAVYMQSGSGVTFSQVTFTNNTVRGVGGQGAALVVSYCANVFLTQTSFVGNAVVGSSGQGGALWVNETSSLALAGVSFTGNSAERGGAIYLASGVKSMSVGGLLPVSVACAGCAAVPTGETYVSDTVVHATDTSGYTAVGYYVVFPNAIPYGEVAAIPVGAVVGAFLYGCLNDTAAGCPAASTAPGVDGVAPYYYSGGAVPVHIARENSKGNPDVSFVLYPRAAKAGCSFSNNVAGDVGGAIYATGGAKNIFIVDSVFARNSAGNGGGAVYLYYFNNLVYFYSTTFTNNTAKNGGAAALQLANVGVHFTDCVFRGNTAQYGGAVYTGFINGVSGLIDTVSVLFDNSTLASNVAALDGGAVYTNTYNKLAFVNSRLQLNIARGRGGGLFADVDTNIVLVSATTFLANSAAVSGGAVGSSGFNNITFTSSTVFDSNRVDGAGGAVAMYGGALTFGTGAINFVSNNAVLTGSAVYIDSSSTTSLTIANSTAPVLFTRNRCLKHGGTLYWIADPDKSSARFFNAKTARRLVFAADNVAPVSPALATEACYFKWANTTAAPTARTASAANATVTDYVTSLLVPTPSFALTDYYRVLNVTDASTTVTASVWTGNGAPNCGGYTAYLSGKSNVTVTRGIATFDQLAAYCYPGSNVTVHFTAQLSGFNRTYDMFFSVAVSFRQCVDGEVLVKNQCVQCPDGKYSFKYSPTATCTPCPPNTVGCAGGKIKAAAGYWRASKTSTVMLECPYPKGCKGGDGTANTTAVSHRRLTDIQAAVAVNLPSVAPTVPRTGLSDAAAGCADGHTGPLCAVCLTGFYFDTGTSQCQSCRGQGAAQLAILIVVPLVVLLLLTYVMLFSSLASDTVFGDFMASGSALTTLQADVERGKFDANKFVAAAKSKTRGKDAKGTEAIEGNGAGEEEGGIGDISAFMKEAAEKRKQVAAAAKTALSLSLRAQATKMLAKGSKDDDGDEGGDTGTKEEEGRGKADGTRDVNKATVAAGKVDEGGDPPAPGAFSRNVGRAEKALKAAGYMAKASKYAGMAQKYLPELKILTTVFQIVTSFRFSLSIPLPPATAQFLKAMSFVNFSALQAGSPQCYTGFDYVNKLLLVTCTPLIVVAVALLLYLGHGAYYRSVGKDHRDLIPRYLRFVIVISYLVLPSVTTTIAGSYSTVNVDPEGLVPGTPRYLRNDYSIAQNSARYNLCFGWATFMIFVYPIGVPALYFYLLYIARDEIIKTKPELVTLEVLLPEDSTERQRSIREAHAALDTRASALGDLQFLRHTTTGPVVVQTSVTKHSFAAIVARQLGFLHGAYERQYYYWEVIETTRRLLLTAVVSVVGTGTSLQIVFGIFIALLFMKLYAFFQPYIDDRHDELQEIAQYQVFFTLFIALLIRTNAFDGAYALALDAALVVANSITAAYTFVVHFQAPAWLGPTLSAVAPTRVAARLYGDARSVQPFAPQPDDRLVAPPVERRASDTSDILHFVMRDRPDSIPPGNDDVIPIEIHRPDSVLY